MKDFRYKLTQHDKDGYIVAILFYKTAGQYLAMVSNTPNSKDFKWWVNDTVAGTLTTVRKA